MITSTDALRAVVDKARVQDSVAIDTEFIWTRTYLPRLGLIQLALSDEECHLIDPLAMDDLSPLGELMADQRVTKILHDAPQDLSILHHATGYVPKNIFDTRLAAGFAGMPATMSLAALILELLDITLPKTETRTNWLKRPLDEQQISYAMDDVRYLRAVRILLINRIIGPEIKSWLQEELDLLNFPQNYNGVTAANRFRRVRGAKSLDSVGLSVLRELSLWRENIAKKKDKPRGHILSDNDLIEISRKRPSNVGELQNTTAISAKMVERWGPALLQAVRAGLACPAENRPHPERSRRLNKKNSQMLDRLNEFIQLKSKVQGIDPILIGNITELKKLVEILNKSCQTQLVRQMEGWRKNFLHDFYRYAN